MTALIYSFKDEKRKREIGKVLDERLHFSHTETSLDTNDVERFDADRGFFVKFDKDGLNMDRRLNDDRKEKDTTER
jgi:RNA binding exosome subunit